MKHLFFLAASAALMFASCTKDATQTAQTAQDQEVAAKILNNPDVAVAGSVFIYVNQEVEAAFSEALTRSDVATRCGISEVDSALSDIQVHSVERLFNIYDGNRDYVKSQGVDRWFIVNFPENVDLRVAAQRLAKLGQIRTVEYVLPIVKNFGTAPKMQSEPLALTPSISAARFADPFLKYQWHMINDGSLNSKCKKGCDVGVLEAWQIETGDSELIVAVNDEGVAYTHPDLAANMWTNPGEVPGNGIDDDGNGYIDDVYGWNFCTNGPISWDKKNPRNPDDDDSGHGTHVAGIISAVNGNNVGVCGIAGGSGAGDGVRIMSTQIFSAATSLTSANEVKSIQYAADKGACILQCSWGVPAGSYTSDTQYKQYNSAELSAFNYFASKKNYPALDGGLIIFAAGNDAKPMGGYPGAWYDFICVTSLAPTGDAASYTNYGPGCNIAAPGGDAYCWGVGTYRSTDLSCFPLEIASNAGAAGYGYMQGTSQATPHVSGVAALGLSYARKLGKKFTLDQFRGLLLTSVEGINEWVSSSFKNKMGTGLIDAYRMLMSVKGIPVIPVVPGVNSIIDLQQYLGDGKCNITITGVTISAADKAALGIASDPSIVGGKLVITVPNSGACIMSITGIAGGSTVGGAAMGGMKFTKEVSLLSRSKYASNGAWL